MDKLWTHKTRRTILQIFIAALALRWIPLFAEAEQTFSYSYGDPSTPLNDGYIVSTSNAQISFENPIRFWKPTVGATTEAATTPAEIIFHFPLDAPSADIVLWMNMPTFHWNYSRGHNLLYGSTDGTNWEQLADVQTPAFASGNDLGTVTIPESLLGAEDLWLKVELFSFGSSALGGGALTNTAQLSRYDINAQNTSFSLNITSNPKPTSLGILTPLGRQFGLKRRRR